MFKHCRYVMFWFECHLTVPLVCVHLEELVGVLLRAVYYHVCLVPVAEHQGHCLFKARSVPLADVCYVEKKWEMLGVSQCCVNWQCWCQA